MIVQGDLLIRDLFREGLRLLQADASPLVRVFEGRPVAEREQVVRYFSEQTIQVKLGFPREPTEVPGVFVSLMPSSEAHEFGGIGNYMGTRKVANKWEDIEGVFVRSNYRCRCLTANPDATVWLQNVLYALLLSERSGVLSEGGFTEQSVTLTDFEMAPESFPSLVYRRDLMVTAMHEAAIIRLVPSLRQIVFTAKDTRSDEQVTATVPPS